MAKRRNTRHVRLSVGAAVIETNGQRARYEVDPKPVKLIGVLVRPDDPSDLSQFRKHLGANKS